MLEKPHSYLPPTNLLHKNALQDDFAGMIEKKGPDKYNAESIKLRQTTFLNMCLQGGVLGKVSQGRKV